MSVLTAVVGLVVILSSALTTGGQPPSPSLLRATVSKLPVYFIENRGVYPDEVAYYVQGADKTLYFTKDGITFRLKGKDRGWVVKLEFVGANPEVRPRGEDRQQAVFSYFKGPEKNWKTGLPAFAGIVYEEIWRGIDLVYRGTGNRLKYEFIVKPGGDPGCIRIRLRGASSAGLTAAGRLRLETPVATMEDPAPRSYQRLDGRSTPVASTYTLDSTPGGDPILGFHVAAYDPARALVIDPTILVYCGYIGGLQQESGYGIAVDAAGNAYVTGTTASDETSFPVKAGPALTWGGGPNGTGDAFVAKVNAAGTALVYCGYIGGSSFDQGNDVVVDAAGNAYVTGWTGSDERTFPVVVGPDRTFNGPATILYNGDAFVAKVNAKGTALVYCGYIGGTGNDQGLGIAVDSLGQAYVAGATQSPHSSFPVRVGPDLTYNSGNSAPGFADDGFVAKVSASGASLVYCGYIGGARNDMVCDVDLDAAGNAYVSGATSSNESTFPVTVGPDLTYNGATIDYDAFVARVNANGRWLDYCGYLGGALDDVARSIAVDGRGAAYVLGYTASDESVFPTRVGPDLTFNGKEDTFVARVHPSGRTLDYGGYIGGAGIDSAGGIAVDRFGTAYVAGGTGSTETTFPIVDGPDLTHNGAVPGAVDAFVAKLDSTGRGMYYCGYVGGLGTEYGVDVAIDATGNAYIVGVTWSTEQTFPVTVGPSLRFTGTSSHSEVFVAKVVQTVLGARGVARPGHSIGFSITAGGDAGLPYQLGTSLGAGPIPIDTRKLNLSPDNLLLVTVNNYWPSVFSGYRGVIDARGQATAAINIPNIPALIGLRLHSAFVTVDPVAPSGIRSISNTFSFSITK